MASITSLSHLSLHFYEWSIEIRSEKIWSFLRNDLVERALFCFCLNNLPLIGAATSLEFFDSIKRKKVWAQQRLINLEIPVLIRSRKSSNVELG